MDFPREAIGPKASNCFSRGSLQVFLRKPIAAFVIFQGGSILPVLPSGSVHEYSVSCGFAVFKWNLV